MDMLNRQAIGEAHGKLILVGEHIVVYDKPAIVIPFPLKMRASIKESPGEITISSKLYTGSLQGIPGNMAGLFECINRSFEICKKPKEGVHIDIVSEIPEGRGLGSSAASATAVIRAMFNYFQRFLSEEELFSLVELAETYAHGKPSGIDMVAVSREEPLLYQKRVKEMSLVVPKVFHIVVADSGITGDTKKAVAHVREIKLLRPSVIEHIIQEIEEIVMKAKEAIIEGNPEILGALLLLNHEKLKELEVSSPMLDHMVEVAIGSGALGAKLTGGGLGGCMIALTKDSSDARRIAKELVKEGAKDAWYFSTNSNKPSGNESGIIKVDKGIE
jgi:mevalonate kinase